MRILDLIYKKKAGEALSTEEINYFIEAYTAGKLPDYQVSALLMAICWRGLDERETADLTLSMANSGERIDLSSIPGIKVDKHSTGGVGDKTTLVIAPLVASMGVPVAKMSGRGLGHTGGTIDKLESVPGMRTDLSLDAFFDQVREIGLAVAGQTANLAPADKKLYALRDVTGTVDNPGLIAGSILSKKIASGADKIVFDVKCGNGAFMQDFDSARNLGRLMFTIGKQAGLDVHVIISEMSQVLGNYVGNRLEVYEAIRCLQGQGPEDLETLSLNLAAEMLYLAGTGERDELKSVLHEKICKGEALDKLIALFAAQGGDISYLEQPEKLLTAAESANFTASRSGYIAGMNTEVIGEVSGFLGAGRSSMEDEIDPVAGLVFYKKIGEKVQEGDTICELRSKSAERFPKALEILSTAFTWSENPVEKPSVILDLIID